MTVLEEAIALLRKQTEKGMAKYGQTLDTADLPLSALLAHKAEEIADELQYTIAAQRAAAAMEAELHRLWAIEEDYQRMRKGWLDGTCEEAIK